MAKYDAILFDVDGTIIHSRPGIWQTFRQTFQEMGVNPDPIDLSRYLGPPLRWSFAQHFSDETDVERAVTIYRDHYAKDGIHTCSLFDGVAEMLGALQDAGLLLATATCKPVEVAKEILVEQGVAPYFTIFGGASMDKSVDTKTAVIRQVLADPRLAGKRILMVGDRQDDMQGAQDCGLPAAGVLYGYGSRAELEPFHPVLLAEDCRTLTRYILEQ